MHRGKFIVFRDDKFDLHGDTHCGCCGQLLTRCRVRGPMVKVRAVGGFPLTTCPTCGHYEYWKPFVPNAWDDEQRADNIVRYLNGQPPNLGRQI